MLVQEAYRHCKAIGAWADGTDVLLNAGVDLEVPGVQTGPKANDDLIAMLIEAMGRHRAWDRAPLVMASAVAPAT